MSLQISDQVIGNLRRLLENAKGEFDSGKDVRLALAGISAIQGIAHASVDLVADSRSRFAAYLIFDLLGLLGFYEGRTDSWYQINAESIKKLRGAAAEYLSGVSKALERKDFDALIDASAIWFSSFHDITRPVTVDVAPKRE